MSPRTEETNARIREEQKERILEAAKVIFAHKGFSETKMSDIAAAANVSYGLAYHYFANKEAIFTNLLQYALQGGAQTHAGCTSPAGDTLGSPALADYSDIARSAG